jgi:hypothetical protein
MAHRKTLMELTIDDCNDTVAARCYQTLNISAFDW